MKNMIQRIQNRKGFTLVELMIVVAIIGILAAIAIPAFLRAVKKSKTSEADGNIKKMVDGAKAYFTSEQKVSKSVGVGGAEPWHSTGKVGYPVNWDSYVFPGGLAVTGINTETTTAVADVTLTANSTDASTVTVPAACTNAPTGGSKLEPFGGVQPAANTIQASVLNKLNISFTDPSYFQYQYFQIGEGEEASAVASARADFKVAGECHTIFQAVVVDDISQEVQIVPSVVQFEFE